MGDAGNRPYLQVHAEPGIAAGRSGQIRVALTAPPKAWPRARPVSCAWHRSRGPRRTRVVTGPPTGALAGTGAAMVLLGVLALVLTRRREPAAG